MLTVDGIPFEFDEPTGGSAYALGPLTDEEYQELIDAGFEVVLIDVDGRD